LWTDARVIWNIGACLNVQNTLSNPEDGQGSHNQHLAMYCSSGDKGTMIRHSDQYREIEYAYVARPDTSDATTYSESTPDYFQLLDLRDEHPTPVGYGTARLSTSCGNASHARRRRTTQRSCRGLMKPGLWRRLRIAGSMKQS
jgi:hypothetical protein